MRTIEIMIKVIEEDGTYDRHEFVRKYQDDDDSIPPDVGVADSISDLLKALILGDRSEVLANLVYDIMGEYVINIDSPKGICEKRFFKAAEELTEHFKTRG